MDKQILLIITYGRSGSTLLMGILNSIDGYKITGENHNAYRYMYGFYNNMVKALEANRACEHNFSIYNTRNPWWNNFTIEQLNKNIRNLMIRLIDPLDNARVVGFKEIRYLSCNDYLYAYLDWLHTITNCNFIFLTRNLKQVCKSDWWAKQPENQVIKKLSAFEKKIKKYMIHNEDYQYWHHLHFNDIYNLHPEDFKDLIKFVGEQYDETKIQSILDVQHGYKTT